MHNHSHQHHHHHGETHEHSHQTHLQKKFKFAVLITFCVFLGELIGGIWSGSLALLSDAVHVFSDAASLLISWLAIYLSTRPATSSRTYGYHRAEVFAAFVNGVSAHCDIRLDFLRSLSQIHVADRDKSHRYVYRSVSRLCRKSAYSVETARRESW